MKTPDQNFNSSQENNESLNLPIIYVIYRDNNLYFTLVPKIAEDMKKAGRKVIVQSFPKGTPEEEIKAYFDNETTKESLKHGELLMDNTCSKQKPADLESEGEHNLDNFSERVTSNSLDSLVGKEVFKNDMEIKYRDELNGINEVVKIIINANGEPEKLFIVARSIDDHNFSFARVNQSVKIWEATTKEEQEQKLNSNEKVNELVSLGIEKDKLVSLFELNDTEFTNAWRDIVTTMIKNSLKDIVSEEKIKIIPSVEDIEEGDKNYVIIDRHAEFKKESPNKITLTLPFSSMVDRIIEQKLIDTDIIDTSKAVEEEVNKMFKK